MRTMRYLMVAAVGVLLLGLSHGALAQQPAQPEATDPGAQAAETIQLTRTLIDTQRQLLVSGGLELTPKEMQGFWPLYREYRVEMAKLGDRLVAVITTYAENYVDLKDDVAGKLLDEYLGIEKGRASVKAKYVPKFKKVLPANKLVRFYQIENKLDIAVLAELTQQIPLAR